MSDFEDFLFYILFLTIAATLIWIGVIPFPWWRVEMITLGGALIVLCVRNTNH